MATARVLAKDKQRYIELAHQLLPSTCPRCEATNTLVLDPDDNDYAYCWSHYGDIYIGPVRATNLQIRRVGPTIDKAIRDKNKRLKSRSLME